MQAPFILLKENEACAVTRDVYIEGDSNRGDREIIGESKIMKVKF